ncbi:MAG: cupin domain-containing protein [Gemmatimonadetes bacterium]|nr:cupin domain-containing protein [Gemmatimonadota bacterium]
MTQAKDRINLKDKLALFDKLWTPKLVAKVNDTDVRLSKIQGEFVWHHHDNTDELFLVLEGELLLQLRDRDVRLRKGEMFVVPRGVEHKPVAEEEAHLMTIELEGQPSTGNVRNKRTVESPEWI